MARIATPEEESKLIRYEASRRPPGRPPTYDWSAWKDGRAWVAIYGEDFTVPPEFFRTMVLNHAGRQGLKASTSVSNGNVIFRFTR